MNVEKYLSRKSKYAEEKCLAGYEESIYSLVYAFPMRQKKKAGANSVHKLSQSTALIFREAIFTKLLNISATNLCI